MYQLIAVANVMLPEGTFKAGQVVWVTTEKRARELLEVGACEWPRGAGPSETKYEDTVVKFLSEPRAGLRIGSRGSRARGRAALSSVSGAALVRPHRH